MGHEHLSDNRFNSIHFATSMPATKFKLLGAVLLFAVFNSQALTLGGMRGAAVVGEGLDIAIPAQLDLAESSANLCFDADVFHGDTRQEPGRVKVSVEPAQTAQAFNVRVVSTSMIDEPIVTIYLRVGCENKVTRRYTLLADVQSEQVVPVAPRAGPVPLITPATTTAAAAAPDSAAPLRAAVPAAAGTRSSARTAQPAAPGSVAPQRARPVAATKPAPARALARKPERPKTAPRASASPSVDEKLQAGRSAGQSRLKLDPLEVLSERLTSLESSTASAPVELAAREARDAQRLQALEASVKSLLTIATRNEASLADMRGRLQQAETGRYSNPLVYVLIVLLLACFAAIAFLLTRRGHSIGAGAGNWWSGTPAVSPAVGAPETVPVVAPPSGFAPSAPAPPARAEAPPAHQQTRPHAPPVVARSVSAPITQVDVSLVEMSESTFDRLMQSGATQSAVKKPRPIQAAELAPAGIRRSINSAELFDIRQQAEFFVSLGQTDQAVRVLENRIGESGESSPLAYLDLLKIFHSLGLRADFLQVREDFNLLFNARVPEFSNFNDEGKGLEEYPGVVAEITASWGSPAVFAAIELCLFRDQSKLQRELFDLAAFRDLLLLHGVAQSVAALPESRVVAQSPAAAYPAAPGLSGYRETRPGYRASQSGGVSAELSLPTIEGVPELDLDLSDFQFPEPLVAAAMPAPRAGGPSLPSDAGNLIDFDLTDTRPKPEP